jgi:hypothetical protein
MYNSKMKLFKAIKLHRKLRKIQEQLCEDCCFHSQIAPFIGYTPYPELDYYKSVNKATNNVSKKLPWIYFAVSDIFGFYNDFRPVKKDLEEEIKKIKELRLKELKELISGHKIFTYDLVAFPG